jgi:plasmid stabilization system protein ParE
MKETNMPRGDKSKYTDKQERKADHIAESYEQRGVSEKEAERRAWATVNKEDGGGKKSGSGRGKSTNHPAAHRGGRLGGAASAARPASERSASAKKAALTRRRRARALEVAASVVGPAGADEVRILARLQTSGAT